MQKNTSNKDCVIILSGGMDSTTLLYEYRDRIAQAITLLPRMPSVPPGSRPMSP